MAEHLTGPSKFWLGVLLIGTSLLGWILTSYKIIWFGWAMVAGGIVLGTGAGLLDGKTARAAARKKHQGLDPATVLGSKARFIAGLIAGLVVWTFVLTGLEIFLQNSPDATWSVSWSRGLVSAGQSAGTIPWSVLPFVAILSAFRPLILFLTLLNLSTACSRTVAGSSSTVVVLGSFYYSILATLGTIAVTSAVTGIIPRTVAKAKISSPGFSQSEVRTFRTVALVAAIGLALGWIVDKVFLPGFGGQLARLVKQCP